MWELYHVTIGTCKNLSRKIPFCPKLSAFTFDLQVQETHHGMPMDILFYLVSPSQNLESNYKLHFIEVVVVSTKRWVSKGSVSPKVE